MDTIIKDFLEYLIDKHDCSGCRYENKCKELDTNKNGNCLCNVAYKSLNKK